MPDAGEKPDARKLPKPVAERRRNVDRSASTRIQIFEATIRALTEFGYGAVTNHIVAELAGVSRGAMMHHFRTKQDLLVAAIEYAYDRLKAYRIAQLEKVKPGLPRFRALIDLAFETAGMPEGLAVNEVRTGSRSDPELAAAVTPMMSHVSDDYGRFLGKHVREAGLVSDQEMRGLTTTVGMASRALAIDSFTHPNPHLRENMVYTLKMTRERIIARQLGSEVALDAGQIAAETAAARAALPKKKARK